MATMSAQLLQPGPLPIALKNKGLLAHAEIEGKHRLVTVLFADVVGFSPLARELGDEGTFQFIQRVIREMSEAIHSEEGTVQELTGDGLMALFGAPIAFEDAPLRACRAALEIQLRMGQFGKELARDRELGSILRLGLNTGSVVIGKIGDDLRMEMTVLGNTVNLAARLESAAKPGEILMSAATHALVSDYDRKHPWRKP